MEPMVCSPAALGNVQALSLIGVASVTTVAALAYLAGESFSNPRLLVWSKTELLQALVSFLIAVILVQSLGVFCSLSVFDVSKAIGQEGYAYSLPGTISKDDSILAGAENFLKWEADYATRSLAAVRYTIGIYELRATQSNWDCPAFCLLGGTGSNRSPQSGEYSFLSGLSIALNTGTVSLLSIIFQFVTLKYLYSGVLLIFLPAGIIMRSVPFMRFAGGSLIAICISLFIFYPLLLVMEALAWPPVAKGIANPEPKILEYEASLQANFWPCDIANFDKSAEQYSTNPEKLFALTTVVFIGATFLPAMNFILIAAAAREISRIIGEEIDISRLSQMV